MVDVPPCFQSTTSQHPSSPRWSPHTTISDDDMDLPLPLPTPIYDMPSDPYYDTITKTSQMPGMFTRWLDPQTPDTMTLLWPSYGANDMRVTNDGTKFHMIDPYHTSSHSNTGDGDSPGTISTSISMGDTTLTLSGQEENDDYSPHRRFTSPSISPPSMTSIYAESTSHESTCNEKRPQLRRHSTSSTGSSNSNSGGGGVRSHECGYCLRTFARRHDLERHTRVHTGIKPYVCPCCLRAFIRSDARGRHFRSEKACRGGPEILAFIKRNIRNTL